MSEPAPTAARWDPVWSAAVGPAGLPDSAPVRSSLVTPTRSETIEPQIHTNLTGSLPDSHPLAFESVDCKVCSITLHAPSNICLRAWAETGRGAFCLACWYNALGADDATRFADDPESLREFSLCLLDTRWANNYGTGRRR